MFIVYFSNGMWWQPDKGFSVSQKKADYEEDILINAKPNFTMKNTPLIPE